MGKPKKPNFRARQLGRTLHRLRKQSGRSQAEVAKRLRASPPKISRIEAGQVPVYAEFELLLDIYGVPVSDWDEYVHLYERACERGWWHAYGADDTGYVGLEAEAIEVREYQLGYIPGLLQTEPYMRAGFVGAMRDWREEQIDNEVAFRLRRQQRLTEEETPLQLHAVIDETVLRRPILDGPDRKAQLRKLIEASEMANVTVQVIPVSRGAHSGRSAGNLIVLSYEGQEESDIGYVEVAFTFFQITDPEKVARARLFFDHLASIALDERDSIALIEQVIAEI